MVVSPTRTWLGRAKCQNFPAFRAVLAFRRIVEIAQIGHRIGDLVGRYAIGAGLVGRDQPASVVLPALEDEDRVDGALIGLLGGESIEVATLPDIDFAKLGSMRMASMS